MPEPEDYELLSKEQLLERLRQLQSDPRLRSHLPEGERLLHELQVHQVELEMQNRALRETQEQLLESGARYADLYDFAPVAYCTLGQEDRIVEANLAAATLLRVERASLIGQRLSTLLPPESRKALREHVSRCFAEQARGTLELIASFRGGEPVVAQLVTMPVISRGVVIACRAALTDISAIKRSEKMLGLLAKASAVLAGSLRGMDPIANVVDLLVPDFADICLSDVVDPDGSVRRIRSGGGEETGLRPDATALPPRTLHDQVLKTSKGILIADLLHPAYQEPGLDRVLEHARSVVSVPLLIRGRAQGVLTLAMIGSGRGFQPADLEFARDVGSRIAAAIDSARLYRDAQQAVQAREQVLAVVSHDLRSPLSGILLASRGLEDTPASSDPLASRLLETIQLGIERMSRMIDDLLDVSSIDAGHLALDLRDQEASELIDDAFGNLRPMTRAKRLRFAADRPESAAVVRCDRERVLQVFSNLIDNAIKFTPRGGSISIGARVRGSSVQFFARDSGPGVDQALLPHLFERYSQATATARRGRGLGLYICKGIVEAHGGRIWADIEPKGGTAVFFTLPLADLAEAALDRERPPVRGGAVMVVDDDGQHRQALAGMLEAAGYAVEQAEDGLDALEQVRSRQPLPMVILLDLQMPRMDGWDLMLQLKRDPILASIPVVLVSGYSKLGAEAEATGANGYVCKPVRAEQLLRAIDRFRQPAAAG